MLVRDLIAHLLLEPQNNDVTIVNSDYRELSHDFMICSRQQGVTQIPVGLVVLVAKTDEAPWEL